MHPGAAALDHYWSPSSCGPGSSSAHPAKTQGATAGAPDPVAASGAKAPPWPWLLCGGPWGTSPSYLPHRQRLVGWSLGRPPAASRMPTSCRGLRFGIIHPTNSVPSSGPGAGATAGTFVGRKRSPRGGRGRNGFGFPTVWFMQEEHSHP